MIPVDLFGQPADYDAIAAVAQRRGPVRARRCRAGASARPTGTVAIGTLAHATATSFFPAKPLGCYGDGGAVFTDDDELADVMRSLRVHGQGATSTTNVRIGMNGRLDTIQAAVLIEKLKIFPDEIAARERVARRYTAALADVADRAARCRRLDLGVGAIHDPAAGRPARRARRRRCKAQGIPTAVYYPKPVHRQDAYAAFPVAEGGLPVTERLADEVISLPMHAYLDEPTQDRIIAAVRAR